MAEPSDSSLAFFTKGTVKQWAFVYKLREAAIRAKADERRSKKGGPEEFIKLDTWYREKLPTLIKGRKDFHLVYEELVQIAKWRLMMGKYRPKMLDLVRINTESSVTGVSRKAFKKISAQKNLQQALTMLVNLKGIGPSTASAILAAAFPEEAPFMSDEGMLSTPGVEATDSTIAEYVNYSDALRTKTQWLQQLDPEFKWTPHKVDQALWIYYVARDLKPQLLDSMPRPDDEVVSTSLTSSCAAATSAGPSSDAADDNAQDCTSSNSEYDSAATGLLPMATTNGNYYGANSSNSNNNNNNNHHHSQEDSRESESASVPYSEEDFSQGGEASCSSSGMGVGVDLSLHHHHSSNNHHHTSSSSSGLNGHYSPVVGLVSTTSSTSPVTSSSHQHQHQHIHHHHTNGTKRSVHDMLDTTTTTTAATTTTSPSSVNNNNNNNHLLSTTTTTTTNGSANEEEDSSSKDEGLLDSEDSRGDERDGRGRLLMMMTTTTRSEENSIDGVVVSATDHHCGHHLAAMVHHDQVVVGEMEPALKKQKTLELSSALAAATADAE